MRGRFSDRPRRIAYGFGRPRVPTECTTALEFTPKRRIQNHPTGADCELSLASTVLARAIARSDWLPESFEPHLAPQLMGLLIGRYVLRMNPLLLLGALAGAQTMTAALAALQEKSGSPVAVLGYTAAVPFGHIFLTSGGTIVVWLMS